MKSKSKKGSKYVAIFGGITGFIIGILMFVDEQFKTYILNHIIIILLIIGFIGGYIGVIYWYVMNKDYIVKKRG